MAFVRSAMTAAVVLACASPALACQCASIGLSERIAAADVILVARISAFTPLDQVAVSVVEPFKGPVSGTLTIRTGRSDCDFFLPPVSPRIGDEYLVYLTRSRGELTANRCLASGLTVDKAEELRELRRRFRPN